MTKSELEKWRFRAPFFIMSTTLVPIVTILVTDAGMATKIIQIAILPACWFMAYLYSAMKWRNLHWHKEVNRHVGAQIRSELIGLLPPDLNTTDEEKERLRDREVFRKLTGVFWEAIDSDAELVSHKAHFYANGALYTTAVDLYLLLPTIAALYLVLSVFTPGQRAVFIVFAVVWLSGGILSRVLILPSCRRRHLELSAEQLDLLKRKKRDFIRERFRDVVTEWRAERLAENSAAGDA